MKNRGKLKTYIVMHLILMLLSMGSVLSKTAANTNWFSKQWILLYAGVLLILCIYAVAWQQILKKINLTVAFCNKASTILWGMIWGTIIFGEKVTWNMLLGAAVVFIGICVVVTAKEEEA